MVRWPGKVSSYLQGGSGDYLTPMLSLGAKDILLSFSFDSGSIQSIALLLAVSVYNNSKFPIKTAQFRAVFLLLQSSNTAKGSSLIALNTLYEETYVNCKLYAGAKRKGLNYCSEYCEFSCQVAVK